MKKVACEDLALFLQWELFSGSLPPQTQAETVIKLCAVMGTPEASPSPGKAPELSMCLAPRRVAEKGFMSQASII